MFLIKKYFYTYFLLTIFACSRNGNIELIDGSLISVQNLKIMLLDTREEITFDFIYEGNNTIYFASGFQYEFKDKTLYWGINDFENYLESSRASYRKGYGYQSDYGLISISEKENNVFFRKMFFVNMMGIQNYENIYNIEEIVLTFYYYTESEINELSYSDDNKRLTLYDFEEAHKEYIEILESGKGQRIEIKIKDFEILDERISNP